MVVMVQTRKHRGVTVDSLHTSFEKIDTKVRRMIEKGCTNSALTTCIRRLWTQQFHRALSAPALQGMVTHYQSLYGYRSRKTRKAQRGGAAPIDWTMSQGNTGYTYARFPVHEGSQPHFVRDLDRFYESPIGRSCDSTGGRAPHVGGRRKTGKRNQKGGGVYDNLVSFATGGGVGASVMMGAPPYSSPQNPVATAVGAFQGHPVGNPPSHPVNNTWHVAQFTPKAYDATQMHDLNMSSLYKP